MAYRKPVTVSLPPPLVLAAARLAKRQHQTTSELVRAALRQYIEDADARRAAWQRARAYGQRRAKTLGIRSEEDVYRLMDEIRHGSSTHQPATARRR